MEIVSLSPFRVGSLLWQPRKDRWTLTIVCKATYTLEPEESGLAAEQEDVNEHENHWDDDPRRSLFAPSDLAPFKARADIMLVGHAFAPASDPVRSLVARMKVGELDKSVEVFGPRVWTREGELREGTRWVKMPLRYERAAGGPGTWNPVGVSPESPLDPYGQRALPNLQRPGTAVGKPSDPMTPTGFGPIASSWMIRRNQLGRHKDTWTESRLAVTPLEEDFDGAYFQAAPPDQQVDAIRDGERIALEHLHPELPILSTTLSGVHPRVFVETGDAPAWDLVMTADTLWIDTDRSICTLAWRGQIGLSSPTQPGRVFVAMEERGRRLTWANIAKIVSSVSEDDGGAAVPTDRRPRIAQLRTLVSIGVTPGMTPEDALRESPEPSRVEVVQAAPPKLISLTRTLPFSPAEAVPSPAADAAQRVAGQRQTLTMEASVTAEIRSSIPAWVAPPSLSQSAPVTPVTGAAPSMLAPSVLATPSILASSALAPSALAPSALAPSALAPIPPPAAPPPSTTLPPRPPSASPPSAAQPPRPPTLPPPSHAVAAPVLRPEIHDEPTSVPPPPTPTAVATAPAKDAPPGPPARVHSASGEPSVVQPTRMGGTPLERLVLVAPARPSLEVIWFDPAAITRIRSTWSRVLRPLTPSAEPEHAAAHAMRADVSAVLVRGAPLDADELESLMVSSVDDGGALVPPLALLHGELELPLDELEALRAAIGVASPLAVADPRLREALDVASEAVASVSRGARDLLEGLLQRVREDWSQASRALPPSHLDAQVEQVLVEGRRYQLREVLDGTWIRALFRPEGASGPDAQIPLYLPYDLARRLPLFKRFKAQIVVEVLPQQDQYEPCPLALKGLALGRAITLKTTR